MFFANIFEVFIVIGITNSVVTKIVAKIILIFVWSRSIIWRSAFAAPVLVFWIRKRMRNELAMINVFIEPSRIRNWFSFSFPVTCEPIIAAWLLPTPGNNAAIGETIVVAIAGFINSFFVILNFEITCLGIMLFV